MSSIAHLLGQLDQPDSTHVWSREDVTDARAELARFVALDAFLLNAHTWLEHGDSGALTKDALRRMAAKLMEPIEAEHAAGRVSPTIPAVGSRWRETARPKCIVEVQADNLVDLWFLQEWNGSEERMSIVAFLKSFEPTGDDE